MSASTSQWTVPRYLRTPDFILCGAMKSGTATLRAILSRHPKVFIPEREVHFFDMDCLAQHPDFHHFDGSRWIVPRLEREPERFWAWYAAHFAAAREDQLIGENSTTYLCSETAARRIAQQYRQPRLIVVLRHPTDRAWAQYWHMIRTGRATRSFEDLLRTDPLSVLQRSLYRQQLEGFQRHLPHHQVKVVLFEEFLADRAAVIGELCDHIGIDHRQLPADALQAHASLSAVPRFPRLSLVRNRLFQEEAAALSRTRSGLPVVSPHQSAQARLMRRINALHRRINPPVAACPPPMNRSTRRLLDRWFERELEGLDELVGRAVLARWFGRQPGGERQRPAAGAQALPWPGTHRPAHGR